MLVARSRCCEGPLELHHPGVGLLPVAVHAPGLQDSILVSLGMVGPGGTDHPANVGGSYWGSYYTSPDWVCL